MFYEQIAEYTKTHMLSHMAAYLSQEQTLHDDKLVLVMPKTIEPGSMLGGTMAIARETLPQYAIQVVNKSRSTVFEDYYAYNYPGQVIAMVGATNPVDADRLGYRHAAAIERMAKEHPHLHEYNDTDGFSLMHWEWQATTFSGVMQLEAPDSAVGELWVNAAQLTFLWVASESGEWDQIA